MARLIVGIAVLVAATGFAPAPRPKPARKLDVKAWVKKLQGTWEIVSLERHLANGARTTSRTAQRYRFEGEKYTHAFPNNVRIGGTIPSGEFKLAASKEHTTMDMVRDPVPGQTAPTLVMRGIVKLEGDTIKFCYTSGSGETERPTSFEKLAPGQILMTLRRLPD